MAAEPGLIAYYLCESNTLQRKIGTLKVKRFVFNSNFEFRLKFKFKIKFELNCTDFSDNFK